MNLFATDRQKLEFLLETEAAFAMHEDFLRAVAGAAVPDVDLSTEEVEEGKRPKYVTNYIGSKQKLLDWIWENTPEGVDTVVDAFAGSCVVSYMYKTKGLQVITNDRLKFSYHTARAIIENNDVRLSNADLEALLADNPHATTVVRDNFGGLFFAEGVHKIIDTIRSNADALPGYKKDIALFALAKTCIGGKGGFGHFTASTTPAKQDNPDQFRQRFAQMVARINALVFDNGKACKAYNKDINDLLTTAKADLGYFDPPYATEFSTTNYEKAYHFVEGLMTYWDGLKINTNSAVRHYDTPHMTVTKANAEEFFRTFLGNAKHIPSWLISYRDHAYPNDEAMRKIIGEVGKSVDLKSHDHKYSLTSKRGEASNAQEYLYVCRAGGGKAKADDTTSDGMATTAAEWKDDEEMITCVIIPVEDFEEGSLRSQPMAGEKGVAVIKGKLADSGDTGIHAFVFDKEDGGWDTEKCKTWVAENEGKVKADLTAVPDLQAAATHDEPGHMHMRLTADVSLSAEAAVAEMPMGTDPTFNFVLCREGMNRNGDVFLLEELAQRYTTAVNKKVDLLHSQEFGDIVGGIISAEYRQDADGGRIDCVGELYVHDSQQAALAYKLMKRGIITQVSMECDYAEGECTICGHKHTSKAEYCPHLKKGKGKEVNGKPVGEILHGVTFTGVGLLDRKGADENARITQVASMQAAATHTEGGPTVDKKDTKDGVVPGADDADAAKKKTPPPFGGGDGDGDGGGDKPVDKDARIKELETENTDLKKQVSDLQKQIDAAKAEKQAADNKARAQKLVRTMEKAGLTFGDENEREAEINRIAEMDDAVYQATEAAYQRAASQIKAQAGGTQTPDDDKKGKDGGSADADTQKAEAGKNGGDDLSSKGSKDGGSVRPLDVNDTTTSLQDKLSRGFQQAWESRK